MEQIGRFKVLRRLGGGGFGEVWLGLDEAIKREVAIKVFKPKDENLIAFATSSDTEGLDVLRARFVNEARILASLEEEPHVVNVMEFGELEDGSPYYVMPYLRQSLAALLGKDVFGSNPGWLICGTSAGASSSGYQTLQHHADGQERNSPGGFWDCKGPGWGPFHSLFFGHGFEKLHGAGAASIS